MPDGSLLIVSMKDQRVLRGDSDGNVSTHADLSEFTDSSLSDMVVDERGRAWVGCFGFDLMSFADPQLAPLMRVDPDGTATVVAEEMMFPNGSVITPDGTTLIVGETAGCRYTAFTIQEDGTLSDRRVWAQLAPTPELAPLQEMLPQIAVGPDGCTLDAETHIWAADEAGARCIRIAPGGEIVEEIHTPEGLGCFACALGGEDGRTLLVCAAPDFLESTRREAREAVLLTVRVDVPHAGPNGTSLEPLGDHRRVGVDAHQARGPRAGVGELVRHARRHDDDVARAGAQVIVAGLEGEVPLDHDPRLVVGMAVKPGSLTRLTAIHDQRDGGPVIDPLEVSIRQLADVYHRHGVPPRSLSTDHVPGGDVVHRAAPATAG
jgi:sugar lactone lactonase YvrE